MYDIEATVRIPTPIEVILSGNQEPTEWSAIPADRGHWPHLLVGDRVIVRLFFSGESP